MASQTRRGDASLLVSTCEEDNYPNNTKLTDFRYIAKAICAKNGTMPKTYASYVKDGFHFMEAWG